MLPEIYHDMPRQSLLTYVNTGKKRSGKSKKTRFVSAGKWNVKCCLKSFPSCFLVPLKTTVLAGMLTPMAKVSVANRTFTSPRLKQISTISCFDVILLSHKTHRIYDINQEFQPTMRYQAYLWCCCCCGCIYIKARYLNISLTKSYPTYLYICCLC